MSVVQILTLVLLAIAALQLLSAAIPDPDNPTAPDRRLRLAFMALALVCAYLAAYAADSWSAPVRWQSAVASVYTPESSGGVFACSRQVWGHDVKYDSAHRGIVGVAHKGLGCGTRVRLLYHGRKLTVRVIDRGPYIAGRTFDLTDAARRRLGFPIGHDRLQWRELKEGQR